MSTVSNKEPPDTEPTASPHAAQKVERSRARRLVVGIASLAALVAIWQIATTFVAYTDDAYVSSDFVAVTPQVTGVIVELSAKNNQQVRRGDLLAVIDKVPFQLLVDQKRAALREAEADHKVVGDDLANAQERLRRMTSALQDASAAEARAASATGNVGIAAQEGSADTGQQATAEQMAAREAVDKASDAAVKQEAVVAQAQAALALAEWQLGQTDIRAPVDGTVNNLSVGVGDTATAGKALIGIVDAAGWRIVANYKEGYIRKMEPGKTAWVWLDTHPWRFYRASVEGVTRGISRGPNQDGILPYVAPTTDWIRLSRRFPVTIKLVDPPSDLTLYMGSDASTLIFQ